MPLLFDVAPHCARRADGRSPSARSSRRRMPGRPTRPARHRAARTGARGLHGDRRMPMCPDGTTIARKRRGRRFASAAQRSRRGSARRRCGRRRAPPRKPSTIRMRSRCGGSSKRILRRTAYAPPTAPKRTRHRLLRAAALRLAHAERGVSRAALCAAGRPPDRRARGPLSGAQGQARARPPRRPARRAVLAARRYRFRQGRSRQGARVRDRSGRRVLPADPGLGTRRARRGRHHARRLRRSERPAVPLGCARADRSRRADARRGVDAGHPRMGPTSPGALPELLDENPSYVFFREVPPPSPGSLEAQIDGPIGSLGVPLLADRTIAVDPRAIPLGAPVFLATTEPLSDTPLAAPGHGAGHRRRDSRADSRRFLLGLRRRCRPAGGPDAPAGRACGCCGPTARRRPRRRLTARRRFSSAPTESSRRIVLPRRRLRLDRADARHEFGVAHRAFGHRAELRVRVLENLQRFLDRLLALRRRCRSAPPAACRPRSGRTPPASPRRTRP